MESSEAARELQARRHRVEKACPICGTLFVGLKRQRFDNKLCANKDAYRRNGRPERKKAGPNEAGSVDATAGGVS